MRILISFVVSTLLVLGVFLIAGQDADNRGFIEAISLLISLFPGICIGKLFGVDSVPFAVTLSIILWALTFAWLSKGLQRKTKDA